MGARGTQSKRPVIFGEVLFDRFPEGKSVLGGAPFNVAWHLQAFGLDPLLISAVGDDELGRGIVEKMRLWGMDTQGIQLDREHPTGTVDVEFIGGEPHFNIVDRCAYDYIQVAGLPALTTAGLIYHGSLALRRDSNRRVLEYILNRLSSPRFIDVNLRDPWWNRQTILELIKCADWVKLNESELEQLGDARNQPPHTIEEFRLNQEVGTIIVTRGAKGAQLYSSGAVKSVAPVCSTSFVDTVGAGDAFTSVLILGLIEKWPVGTTMKRAQEFASELVCIRGATTEDRGLYAKLRAHWDDD